jgi:hypothetical protein
MLLTVALGACTGKSQTTVASTGIGDRRAFFIAAARVAVYNYGITSGSKATVTLGSCGAGSLFHYSSKARKTIDCTYDPGTRSGAPYGGSEKRRISIQP